MFSAYAIFFFIRTINFGAEAISVTLPGIDYFHQDVLVSASSSKL